MWEASVTTSSHLKRWLCSHCFILRSLRSLRFSPPGERNQDVFIRRMSLLFGFEVDIFMFCLSTKTQFPFPLLSPFRGCLFYGPPGTGKTLVARALANECSQGDKKVSFFMRKGADCLSKWVGESERQLRLLFDQVSNLTHFVTFLKSIFYAMMKSN